jgi:CTP:molybdopterin cytidylyltransferase MocA
VISEYKKAGIAHVIVVTGGYREEVEREARQNGAIPAFNPDYQNGEMADSLRTGLREIIEAEYEATFIALGDQPGIQSDDIQNMANLFQEKQPALIIPSVHMRRGHPWLIARSLWNEIMELPPTKTMKDFIDDHKDQITYYITQHPMILQDLDTPEDYEKYRSVGEGDDKFG